MLNIGEEETKGNTQSKATYELLKADDRIDFVGNVEASYLFTGDVYKRQVLEVDGVDLMGHGARTDFARLDLLFEVFHRDVRPHVAAGVDQDGVDALHVVEDRREVVVMLDLRGIL